MVSLCGRGFDSLHFHNLPAHEGRVLNFKRNTIMKSKMLCGLFALMMAAMMSSCEKMVLADGAESENKEQGNVVVRVAQFEQQPFEATRGAAADYCTRLCFHVYGDDGVRVAYVNEKQENEGFGTASFTLEKGHYYLVVVGHSASSNPSFSAGEKVSISGKNMGDTFWCCEELEVGDEGIEKNLVLRRIVSLVRFISQDDAPAGMDQLLIKYTGSRGTFSGLTGYATTTAAQTVDLTVSPDDTQFEFFMIPREQRDTISVKISSYSHNANGNIVPLTDKTIEKVPLRRNCVTICRGSLFDGKSSAHSVFITVSVDGEWDEDINLTF